MGLTIAELTKMLTIGAKFITAPVSRSLMLIHAGSEGDVSGESFKAAAAELKARDDIVSAAQTASSQSSGSSSSVVGSSNDARFSNVALAMARSIVLYVGPPWTFPLPPSPQYAPRKLRMAT